MGFEMNRQLKPIRIIFLVVGDYYTLALHDLSPLILVFASFAFFHRDRLPHAVN